MLNFAFLQAPVGANQQIRLTAQQRQQLALRSMSTPASIQVSRSTSLTSQSDNSYPPLSPIMVLQSQVPQRMQRTISIPGNFCSVIFSEIYLLNMYCIVLNLYWCFCYKLIFILFLCIYAWAWILICVISLIIYNL